MNDENCEIANGGYRLLMKSPDEEIYTDIMKIPMNEAHFWAWLEKHDSGNYISNLRAYLASFGFNKEVNFLSSNAIEFMRHIQEHFYFIKYSGKHKISN